jgi:hypothetical protein
MPITHRNQGTKTTRNHATTSARLTSKARYCIRLSGVPASVVKLAGVALDQPGQGPLEHRPRDTAKP